MSMIFEIGDKFLPALQKRVEKAAKRAPKVGLPVPSLKVISQQFRSFEVYDRLGEARGYNTKRRVLSPTVTVVLDGFLPNVGDWSMLGYRYLMGDELRTIGSDVPEFVKNRDSLSCEHCQAKRNRFSTTILRNNKSNDVFEIGNNCASAFMGYNHGYDLTAGSGGGGFSTRFKNTLDEAGKILDEFQKTSEIDLEKEADAHLEDIQTVLAVAHRQICDQGFLSATDAGIDGWPTWRQVEYELQLSRQKDAPASRLEITALDFLAAEGIVASFQDPYPTNFNLTVRATIQKGAADRKDIAILTAAVNSYIKRQIKNEENREEAKLASNSVYLREEGKRFDFIGRVYRVRHYESDYGPISFITMFDPDMNLVHWKASGKSLLKEGEAYEMKGTVKKHRLCVKGAFEGCPETVVTRVKVSAALGPTAFDAPRGAKELNQEDEEALDDFLAVMGH